jgi:deoxyribodipyrimidine photolyase-related protein
MFVVFPNQLYYDKGAVAYLKSFHKVIIVEEPILFYDRKYRPVKPNKLKLAYMVCCMKAYYSYLKSMNVDVDYISYADVPKILGAMTQFTSWNPHDKDIIKKYAKATFTEDSPYFLMQHKDVKEFHEKNKVADKFSHASFYKFVKSKLHILENTPSYDAENRRPLPKSTHIPASPVTYNNNETRTTCCSYVNRIFRNHIGNADPEILKLYPTTAEEAMKHLSIFCKTKLTHFGDYQDAVDKNEVFLFHSNLSSAINIGILTPLQVLAYIMKSYASIPINSLEGFIRQLIGWREYCRYIYDFHYDALIKSNHFGLSNNLSPKWYTATTGITPLDEEIKKAIKYAYAHHIVRLMVFLNLLMLTETKPYDVYKWFMEVVAIDAYDWVMRSNIQIMSYNWPHAMRKPYLSTSSYMVKMSNYKKNATWDALFYAFLKKHKSQLQGGAMVYFRNLSYFEKLPISEQNRILDSAKTQL